MTPQSVMCEFDFSGQTFGYDYETTGNFAKLANAENSLIVYSYDKTGLPLEEQSFDATSVLRDRSIFK